MAEKYLARRPQDTHARRNVGEAYERYGRFHAAVQDWRAAREWYQKSLDIWRNWSQWGVVNPYSVRRERQAMYLLAEIEIYLHAR